MKIKLTFINIFIFYLTCCSQIEGMATYEILRSNDYENRYDNNSNKEKNIAFDKKIDEFINNQTFYLRFKNGKSHFSKKNKLLSDKESSSFYNILEALYPDTYYDFKTQKNYIVDNYINKDGFLVVLKDRNRDIKFFSEDFDEVKQGIFCSKAIITHKKNNKVYHTEIWYAKEINLPYGPLSFNGFPGLVVLVKENTGTLIMLKKIHFENQNQIEIPKLKEIKEDELEAMYDKAMKKVRN